jgi:hypothetical protein
MCVAPSRDMPTAGAVCFVILLCSGAIHRARAQLETGRCTRLENGNLAE